MKFVSKHKALVFVLFYLLFILISLPSAIILMKKPIAKRTMVSRPVTLSFSPASFTKETGDIFTLAALLDPGTHAVSFISLDIRYDQTKLSLDQDTAFQTNTDIFPTTFEGPLFTPGRIHATIAIGADPKRAVKRKTRIATITFKAISPVMPPKPLVYIDKTTTILSLDTHDSAVNNVLRVVKPAQGEITGNTLFSLAEQGESTIKEEPYISVLAATTAVTKGELSPTPEQTKAAQSSTQLTQRTHVDPLPIVLATLLFLPLLILIGHLLI